MPDELPTQTATRESWKILPCPETRAELGFREQYTQPEFDRIGQGLIPVDMEDKWFIFYDAPWLFLHRSWTGICIYAVRFECSEVGASVAESWVNRDGTQYPETRVEYDRALLKFLIDALLLQRPSVFPVPPDAPGGAPDGIFQHAVVGRAYPEVTVPLKGHGKHLNFLIPFVDHEPDDLRGQLPVRGRLLRKIGGPPRRPEYWLGELAVPVSWTSDGVTRAIRHVILTARWEGTAFGPGAKLPVNLWYVIDDAVIGRESFEASQAQFVAIGTIMVSKLPIWWLRVRAVFSIP